jgi:hypothetical protein
MTYIRRERALLRRALRSVDHHGILFLPLQRDTEVLAAFALDEIAETRLKIWASTDTQESA